MGAEPKRAESHSSRHPGEGSVIQAERTELPVASWWSVVTTGPDLHRVCVFLGLVACLPPFQREVLGMEQAPRE